MHRGEHVAGCRCQLYDILSRTSILNAFYSSIPPIISVVLQELEERDALTIRINVVSLRNETRAIHLYHIIHANCVDINKVYLLRQLYADGMGLATVCTQAAGVVVLEERVHAHAVRINEGAVVDAQTPRLDALCHALAGFKIRIVPRCVRRISKRGNRIVLHVAGKS